MSEDAVPTDRAGVFLALHGGSSPLLLANAWDVGTAKVLAHLGFLALATTSAGHAAVLGRPDGQVTRDEALVHATELAAATALPLNADLENGFADDPDEVARTYRLAAGTGIAGCSIEDYDPVADTIYDLGLARERVAAAADAAHTGPRQMVLTARCEHHIRGVANLDATIVRLQSYQEAGADVLYAPGLTEADDIARVVSSVDRPVNVLALPCVPDVAELGRLGVARVSVGSGFSLAAMGGLVDAARELLDQGTYNFWGQASRGGTTRRSFDR
ncbi:isocitrate lyase/phosphoenolpyruvate mutase family protein [soil metagenome]